MCKFSSRRVRVKHKPDNNCVSAEELKRFHCNRVQCGDCEEVNEYDNVYTSNDIPELSSEVASSTIKRFGLKTRPLDNASLHEATLTISSAVIWP